MNTWKHKTIFRDSLGNYAREYSCSKCGYSITIVNGAQELPKTCYCCDAEMNGVNYDDYKG